MNNYEEDNHKLFVQVTVKFDLEGNVVPLAIIWNDGRFFEIDKVLDKRRAASLKAGGLGMRYKVRIKGKEFYLFYEEPKWFLEV